MKVLDLFCCCGGAAKGLSNNGNNKVTGVDITKDHEYPFEFIGGMNVFDLSKSFFDEFDLIWASPPCQHYILTNKYKDNKHPDLVADTRNLLIKIGKPFIIENVPNAPIRKDLLLCGEMFEGLRILRHRVFEFGNGFNKPFALPHRHRISLVDGSAVGVYSGGIAPGCWGNKKRREEFIRKRKETNTYSFSIKEWQKAMGIDWITKRKHLAQAIPPAYSNYIITNKVKHVKTIEDYLIIK